MKTLLHSMKKSTGICRYFYRFAMEQKRSYPVLVIGNVLLASILPFIAMMLPKYIIEELTGGRDITKLIILTYW